MKSRCIYQVKINKIAILFFVFVCFLSRLNAQVDTTESLFIEGHKDSTQSNKYLSLEELVNVKVITASKESESKFDAPSSISVITRDQIMKAGCNSIPEAFRLAPGMIVRQQNTGNYDVHIRGFDNVLPVGNQLTIGTNSITLVMIDGRPVNNYFQGGTFWETLPISIADVDRIEIVRGPSSALYGPNAAAGVINIITQKNSKKGVVTNADVQYGINNDLLVNGAVHYNLNSKLNLGASFNHKKLYRTSTKYYDYFKNRYVERDSLNFLGNVLLEDRYPSADNALDNFGVNAFLDYSPNENVVFDFSIGIQQSEAQRIYVDNQGTPLTTNTSESHYINLNAKMYNWFAQFSHSKGVQNTLGMAGWEYDFNTVDALLEYEVKWKNFKIRPGFNYRTAIYNDEVSVEEHGIDRAFLGGEKILSTYSGMLRTEFSVKKLRLIAALRYDQYNKPNKAYIPYQMIATYKFNEKNIVRFVVSKATRGAFLLDTYYNQNFIFNPVSVLLRGNEELDLLEMGMYELGFRNVISKKVEIDAELFTQKSENYASLEDVENDDPFLFDYQFQNIKIQSQQYGATFNITFLPVKSFYINTFVTVQKTYLTDYPVLIDPITTDAVENTTLNSTPVVSGGLIMNYNYNSKLNFNVSSYLLSEQELNTSNRLDENDEYFSIAPTFVLNAKIDYRFSHWASFYINARNILNQDREEVFLADQLSPMLFIGLSINFDKKE